MAIQFARIEIVSRSKGGNACCKAAYNARIKIKDELTNIKYDFTKRGDNVYHTVLLPNYVDQKFKDPKILMNEVEKSEKRKNSQLLKDVVIALPDDKELALEDRLAITHEIIDEMGWVKNGLGAQVDIHKPHKGERNWHAHVLVTTRRFTKDGKNLGAKAVDLNPQFKKTAAGKAFIIPEEEIIHEKAKEVINRYFEKLGLDNRVDALGAVPQEHIGPVRMRSLINKVAASNELVKDANLKIIKEANGLLDHITKYQAIFSKKDVQQAIQKVEDETIQEQVIVQVMRSPRLVKLYHQDGKATNYYTTTEVRAEELRLLRVADKVNQQANYDNIYAFKSNIENLTNVSELQREALKTILVTDKGIRILRGRAGTGKSHVLGIAYQLATSRRQNVIGLAPTHKAVTELKDKGYEQCHTVKGFLFKLYNSRINLPRNSLLVVDEAGMVGTSDYLELFKVARKYNCQIILAGDERQLTSIERSGMFEVFTSKFGSYVLSDIRRQSQAWGRQMAMCFAEGDIVGGVQLLARHQGLKFNGILQQSIDRLVNDWSNSQFPVEERLIITVGNKEVASLNLEIRKLLKEQKVLTGTEYRATAFDVQLNKEISEEYMKGDRIIFKTSNKELQTKNGEFASLIAVSQNKFIAKTDKGQTIIFNPQDINFKHGYASTVYKAQGASIKDVYVLHNLAGNSRSSYVEMTRHVEKVGLYANMDATKGAVGLISQLNRINDKSASIDFCTQEDLIPEKNNKQQGFLEKASSWLKSLTINIGDRLHLNQQYYQIENNIEPTAKVEEVLTQTAATLKNTDAIAINDNNQQAGKIREVAVDKIAVGQQEIPKIKNDLKANSLDSSTNPSTLTYNSYSHKKYLNELSRKQEMTDLKRQLFLRVERVAYSLLGSPNKYLSNNHTLRWGENGKIVMKITGSKAGIWHDFSNDTGGDLFTLVQRENNCSFIQAKEYLQDMVGMVNNYQNKATWLKDLAADEFYQKAKTHDQKEQYVEEAKIKYAQDLYDKSNSIKYSPPNNITRKYLSEHRSIETILTKYQLRQDLRTNMMWDNTSKQHYPALIAFARDTEGKITGGQSIYLHKETAAKADIAVNKRSFGKITGSFVAVQQSNEQNNNITIIAEGVETALSLQEAGLKGNILCSLGVSNIKNYQPKANERIIIAADNDGQEAPSLKAVNNAKKTLEQQGAIVSMIMPKEHGDFNDVLKTQGKEAVRELLTPEIKKLALGHKNNQIKSIELELLKSTNTNVLQNFQNEIKALERFTTTENLTTALQIYKDQGMVAFITYSNKTCSTAIGQKITTDLQTMKNKFNPNYNLGNVKFSDIVIHDFKGTSHTIPEDYLAAIGEDKQVMQYLSPKSNIAEQIKNELNCFEKKHIQLSMKW
ncbi:AAA family ATPase [Rickettsia tamurae]|nr:AAA family ATPase [Rickettsia tamurae]